MVGNYCQALLSTRRSLGPRGLFTGPRLIEVHSDAEVHKATPEQFWIRTLGRRMPFGKVLVAIANKHVRNIWAMLRETWTTTGTRGSIIRCISAATRPTQCSNKASIQRQCKVLDSGSGRPRQNLTNWMDVQTVLRLTPGHGTVR